MQLPALANGGIGEFARPLQQLQPIHAGLIHLFWQRAGLGVTLSAAATGAPRPAYQWRFKGIEIAGGTNATLTLNNVQGLNAGNYSVVAHNFIGSVSSTNALLTVLSAVLFDPVPVLENGLLRWQINGQAGNNPLVIQSSTNLIHWQPIFTNNLPAIGFEFVDPQWTNYLWRFYRALQ